MVMYVNTHLNPIHIVVDGSLREIKSGEEFYSKKSLKYDFVNKIEPKSDKVVRTPKQKKRVKDGNSKPAS